MTNSPVVETFISLARIDSPSGSESQVAGFLSTRLQKLGFVVTIDPAGNLFATNNRPGTPVLINAHMDTVEPGRNIKPQVVDGIIKSDGSTIIGADNKSAIAAIITALEEVPTDQTRPLEILFSVREETDGGVNQFDFSRVKSRSGLVADRASQIGSMVLSSPWILNLNIDITGRSVHASLPEQGINAITIASKAISGFNWGRVDDRTTANIGLISGGSAMNSIPGQVSLIGEIRSFSELTLWQTNDQIRSIFANTCQTAEAKLQYTSNLYCPGYNYNQTDQAVTDVANVFRQLNLPITYETAFGASDANVISSKGIQLVNVGDGCINPHTVQESISVNNLELLKKVFVKYIQAS